MDQIFSMRGFKTVFASGLITKTVFTKFDGGMG